MRSPLALDALLVIFGTLLAIVLGVGTDSLGESLSGPAFAHGAFGVAVTLAAVGAVRIAVRALGRASATP